ncbi:MAG TPA: DUF2088 domain-containing protein [Spirochaetia bacterium]|nr:DUF2088 domain-containing protein [Spirochaetia bacterium]
MELPRFVEVRQHFPDDGIADCALAVRNELGRIGAAGSLTSGRSVVIAVGSRGIDGYEQIVRAAAEYAAGCGSVPVIVPAMGSHAGGTAQSQSEILLDQGIGAPGFPASLHSCTDTVSLGQTDLGDEIWFDKTAARADVLIVINRVKAHTDYEADVESGVAKMLVVGLGKPHGAAEAHRSFRRHGFYPALSAGVRLILAHVPKVIGIAIVENESHRSLRIEAIDGPNILARESELLLIAKARMARLPMQMCDLLVVEEIGKNISGSGMDTNIVSRKSIPAIPSAESLPKIEYIYVRSLSPESHGNGVGIGLADFCGDRALESIDLEVTYLNCLTSGTPRGAAIPVHLGSDRKTFEAVCRSLPLRTPQDLRVAWIENTLALDRFFVSEMVLNEPGLDGALQPMGRPVIFSFDGDGNLTNPFTKSVNR